jgi:hypothetical protein
MRFWLEQTEAEMKEIFVMQAVLLQANQVIE